MKLISEHFSDDVEYIKEEDEKTGKNNYKLKGIFLQSEIRIEMVEYILLRS